MHKAGRTVSKRVQIRMVRPRTMTSHILRAAPFAVIVLIKIFRSTFIARWGAESSDKQNTKSGSGGHLHTKAGLIIPVLGLERWLSFSSDCTFW